MKCYVVLCFQYLLTSGPVDNPPLIHTCHTLHPTHVWYMQYLQVWNTPSPSNPYLLWSGNQRQGTLSFTRMQFFIIVLHVFKSGLHNFLDFWLICLIYDHINPYLFLYFNPPLYLNQP